MHTTHATDLDFTSEQPHWRTTAIATCSPIITTLFPNTEYYFQYFLTKDSEPCHTYQIVDDHTMRSYAVVLHASFACIRPTSILPPHNSGPIWKDGSLDREERAPSPIENCGIASAGTHSWRFFFVPCILRGEPPPENILGIRCFLDIHCFY